MEILQKGWGKTINKEHWRNATNMLERCDVSKPQSDVFY
jgi:hypothetical protein